MAKKTYVGVNNIARNVSKMYVGVNGVARRVKKAYVGVNGVAKQFYRKIATSVTKISSGLDFSYGMSQASTAQNNNYVFFNGDSRPSSTGSTTRPLTVNAFSKSLTRSIPTDLYSTRLAEGGFGISFDDGAILQSDGYINKYDVSLTRTISSLSSIIYNAAYQMESTNMTDFGILNYYRGVYSCNKQLTISNIGTAIKTADRWWDPESCASFSDKSYFFGQGNPTTTIYYSVNKNLTITNEGDYSTFSDAVHRMACGATDSYVFCVGGMKTAGNYNSATSKGVAIDKSGTKYSVIITNAVTSMGGAASDDLFLVGGGRFNESSATNMFYKYNNSLTRSTITSADYKLIWNYGNAYWNGYFIFHNSRDADGEVNHTKANLYQEQ